MPGEGWGGGGLQVCKAAGCYNTLTQRLYKPGAIQLRLRWYLVSWNGSLVDGVVVQQTQRPTLPERPGYWWLAPRFGAAVPTGFYRCLFELDGLWALQEEEVYVLNNRAISIGNILPFDRATLHYYGSLALSLSVTLSLHPSLPPSLPPSPSPCPSTAPR
jgi:hypothetical protein